MKTVEEGYELFDRSKAGRTHFQYYFIDALGACVFEDYQEGYNGYRERNRLAGLGAYTELEKVKSFDDFAALVARVKLEMSVCE